MTSEPLPDFARDARERTIGRFVTAFFLLGPLVWVPATWNLMRIIFGEAGPILVLLGIMLSVLMGVLRASAELFEDATPGVVLTMLFAWFGGVVAVCASLLAIAYANSPVHGRRLSIRGRGRVAELEEESSWTEDRPELMTSAGLGDAPAGVADAWRSVALAEHASVAAFGRLSVELVAVGAPPIMIEAAHVNALDEVRHTRLALQLAQRIDGKSVSPSDLPVATAPMRRGPKVYRLSMLAVEAMLDAALNEGAAARMVAELSKVAHPEVREILQEIARDEARHARDARDIMLWCVEIGGPVVQGALRAAVDALADQPGESPWPDAGDGRWEYWGIPSRAREINAYQVVRRQLLAKVHTYEWSLSEIDSRKKNR